MEIKEDVDKKGRERYFLIIYYFSSLLDIQIFCLHLTH